MKVHTNTLTFADISGAVPENCYLTVFNHPGFGRTRGALVGSRSHDHAWVVRLSGTSKHTMDTRNLVEHDKAATYDEWGIFIARLFSLDPGAKIGVYKDEADFNSKTDNRFQVWL
jgi:hypothetical protein